jgi:DNA primase
MTDIEPKGKESVMAEQWVSFQQIKDQASINDVVDHYGLQLRARKGGDELVGLCPFHGPGKSRDPFRVSVSKKSWHCFQCDRGGNLLDLVMAHEGVSIREAALLVQQWFGVDRPADVAEPPPNTVEPVNPPLTFELKNLDPKHPYLKERGLNPETTEYFGLGYYPGHRGRGYQKGRIVIPIHNEHGKLVAYAGRWPGEPPEGEPRYKLPVGFVKTAVVFNLHRATELAREKGLVAVEGFFGAMKVHQAGFPNVVALMGSFLSEAQTHLLRAALGPQGKVTLMFDGDEDGRKCQEQCLLELSHHMFVKVVELDDGIQPDHLPDDQLRQLLAG